MASGVTEGNVLREIESFAPVDDFAVGVVRVFGAKGRPTDETFEHDCADGPPVAAERVAFSSEDFWSNVIRGSDSRVSHNATRFAPGVDLTAVADSEVYLVEVDGGAVVFWFGR